MSFEILMFLIAVIGLGGLALLVPLLKNKGLQFVALLCVTIVEKICEFMDLNGYGQKKYEFVKMVLLIISPKLTDEQIKTLIESMVDKMKKIIEALK